MPPRPATATAPVPAVLGVDSSTRSTRAAIVDARPPGARESSRDPVARATPSLLNTHS
ncbi:hypothetical protein [Streptomyces sp900116325]|uniref:hypothetical protein n=1 Tax=Streptomyces sp. 900116325 TaxID=3154295 RepID=UPI0033B575C4